MKRLVQIIIIAAVLVPFGGAQSIPISGQAISQYGSPVSGAAVYICSASASTGLPCTPVASIYYDYNLTMSAPNPYSTDANGNFSVYVGPLAFPNTYVVNIVANPGGTPYTQLYPGPSCPLSGCTFSGNVTAPIFNATSSPYYEINGVQISSSALSDAANLAKLNASNVFTGTTQTAPVFNATSGFTLNGTALASTNLSDTANIAYLNAANTFTGATNTFAIVKGTTINATGGFQVNGTALSASNLSNGVSGTGAVCLASGSACAAAGTVTSVGVSTSTATQLVLGGTNPVTSSGTITLALNLTGTEAKLVTAATAGTATHCAVWDSSSGIGDSGSGCPPATVQNDVTGSRNLSQVYTNSNSYPILVEASASQAAVCSGAGFQIAGYSNSVLVVQNGTGSCSNYQEWASITFLVPPSGTYEVIITNNGTTGTLNKWIELPI